VSYCLGFLKLRSGFNKSHARSRLVSHPNRQTTPQTGVDNRGNSWWVNLGDASRDWGGPTLHSGPKQQQNPWKGWNKQWRIKRGASGMTQNLHSYSFWSGTIWLLSLTNGRGRDHPDIQERSTDLVFFVIRFQETALTRCDNLASVFVDNKCAFYPDIKRTLWTILAKMGIGIRYKSSTNRHLAKIRVGKLESREFSIRYRVREDWPPAPILFNMHLFGLIRGLIKYLLLR